MCWWVDTFRTFLHICWTFRLFCMLGQQTILAFFIYQLKSKSNVTAHAWLCTWSFSRKYIYSKRPWKSCWNDRSFKDVCWCRGRIWNNNITLDCFLFVCFANSDVDECYTRTHNCDELARCTNTEGSFQCLCRSGYSGRGTISNCYGKWALLIIWEHVLAGSSLALPHSLVIIFKNRTCCSPWTAK